MCEEKRRSRLSATARLYEHRQFTHESTFALILTNGDRAPNRDDSTDNDDNIRSGSTVASQRSEAGHKRRLEDRLQRARGCRRQAEAPRLQAGATAAAMAGEAIRDVSKRLPEPERSPPTRARLLPVQVELWFSYTRFDGCLQKVFMR